MSRFWNCVIFAFWALAMGLLFREKVMPGLLQVYYPTYPAGLSRLQEEDYVMGIYIVAQATERRIGTSHTMVMELAPAKPGDPAWSITNDTDLDISALGLPIGSRVDIRTVTLLDQWYHVKSHDVIIKSAAFEKPFTMNGVVDETRKNVLRVRIDTPLMPPETRELHFENAMSLAGGLAPFHAPDRLRIGQEWTIHQIDPLSLIGTEVKSKPMLARVDRTERHVFGRDDAGNELAVDCFVIVVRGDRYESQIWVDEAGHIIKERVPFYAGVPLLMRRESPPEGPK